MRVNFLSNHWLCSAILLATTNWARYKEKEKDKERKLRKLHCTNSCFFAKIDIFKLFAVHVSFILSLGTGTYGDVGPYVQQVLKEFPFFSLLASQLTLKIFCIFMNSRLFSQVFRPSGVPVSFQQALGTILPWAVRCEWEGCAFYYDSIFSGLYLAHRIQQPIPKLRILNCHDFLSKIRDVV